MTWWKKSKLSKEQQTKLNSLKKTLEEIEKEVEKMMEQEPRVLQLDDWEIVLGVAQLRYEELLRKAMNNFIVTGEVPTGPIGETIKKTAVVMDKQQTDLLPPSSIHNRHNVRLDLAQAERDFDAPEFSTTNKKVVH